MNDWIDRVDKLKTAAGERRKHNRELMPESTAIVDELRKVFGALPYGRFEENGRTVEWGERKNLGEPVQASLPVKK